MKLPQIASGTPLYEAALLYGKQAWPVVPMHSPTAAGCSCSAGAECPTPGKHPRTMHGVKDATTDGAQIRDWWTKWPTANIAVAVPLGFVVLDVDDESALPALLDHGIDIAGTATTTSSPGRAHYWFSTDVEIANVVGILPGLDIRSHGALIVVPPSRHTTGSVYAFSTTTDTIAAAPPELATLVNSRHSVSGRAAAPLGSVFDGVPEGSRDTWIFRQACRLVVKNLHEGEQRHLILTADAECSPPFPERRALQKL